MQATQTSSDTLSISREKLLSLISQTFGGASVRREDEEHPLPPGSWDPIIRKVSKKIFGPFPEPWRSELNVNRIILGIIAASHPEIFDIIGGGRFDFAALNPQPLPPRSAFLVAVTEEVIDRALLMQEAADALNQTGEQQSIIIVSGKFNKFVDQIDELCPRIPKKFPKPKGGSSEKFSAVELLAAGAVFEQNAAVISDEGLRQELSNAGAKFIEMGIARM